MSSAFAIRNPRHWSNLVLLYLGEHGFCSGMCVTALTHGGEMSSLVSTLLRVSLELSEGVSPERKGFSPAANRQLVIADMFS